MLRNIKTLLILILLCSGLSTFGLVATNMPSASALVCPDGFDAGPVSPNQVENSNPCENHQTGSSQADNNEKAVNLKTDCKAEVLTSENCGIIGYIVLFTRVLSGLVGIVVIIMIAVGGIQYTTARDDPQAVAGARERIRNAVLALVFYLVSLAFLQWLVPGGVF